MNAISKLSKITVALTQDMTDMVRVAVESGDYASGSEVVREALREWKLKRSSPLHDPEALRRIWAEALTQGPPAYVTKPERKREPKLRIANSNDQLPGA